MNASTIQGLTSIVIPCWNGWEFTQQCIAALKEHTRPSWELIVVDNGSSDETRSYLAGVRDLSSVPVTIVSNTINVGFPAAINQGLGLARGEYLVLLNNDVVVTDGWLDQLVALVNARGPGREEREGASVEAQAEGEWRPAVKESAGSGDPRTAPAGSGDPRTARRPAHSARGVRRPAHSARGVRRPVHSARRPAHSSWRRMRFRRGGAPRL